MTYFDLLTHIGMLVIGIVIGIVLQAKYKREEKQ